MRICSFATLFIALTSTAICADDMPGVMHVSMVAPHILSITLRDGRVERGGQIPYDPQQEDKIENHNHHRWVKRDGKAIGTLAGIEGDVLYELDRLVGERLDTAWADQPGSYQIISTDDSAYVTGTPPTAVHRKSRATGVAVTAPWRYEYPAEHTLYLELSKPLTVGKQYTVKFSNSHLADQSFIYDPAELRSEAVHVTHLGFRPDDPAKVAFLSCWMGSGGGLAYDTKMTFHVLENESGRSVFDGEVILSKAANDMTEDAYKRNYNGTDVYEMDFSPVQQPGIYRISIDGIGCSYPFEIGQDVWRNAFTVSARGFYHQRSGIALGPPYTSFKRPRSFHPDDGVKVYASTTALMDTGNGLAREDSNFGNLIKGKADQIVPDAWGGYMDAGDWDRRIQHLNVSRLLLELAELFPEYFNSLPLNIPESDDGLPDIVSEALFNLDFYRRMQTPEGGIRGGIESVEHPRRGEGSWQESLTVLAYAPGVWSSHVYAGVAARAAYWLESSHPELADIYRRSALNAMRWAESELPGRKDKNDPHAVNDARNLAAAELFRLTGDAEWHNLFLATTAFKDSEATLYKWRSHEQRDAAWVYLRTGNPDVDQQIRENCLNALRREADERVASCRNTGFRWAKDPWRPVGWGVLGAPDGISLVRAHVVTGEEKYLRAVVLACQTGAGANPVNICYTTGLGRNSPQNPLHLDSRVTNQPPPPGLTVFGPGNMQRNKDYWLHKSLNQICHPPVEEWPTLEAYWDVFWYVLICEFTVQQTMAPNAYVWGYLAARP
ncbi:glycoside hydrolase family 9 protein [Candidatus Poribacteria bacterium]